MTNTERLLRTMYREITRKNGRIMAQSEDQLVTRVKFQVYPQLAAVYDVMYDGGEHVLLDSPEGEIAPTTLVITIR